jgi:hypothetical protein
MKVGQVQRKTVKALTAASAAAIASRYAESATAAAAPGHTA